MSVAIHLFLLNYLTIFNHLLPCLVSNALMNTITDDDFALVSFIILKESVALQTRLHGAGSEARGLRRRARH